MSKPDSYYDWELQFRKKTEFSGIATKRILNNEKANSLGISDKTFKEFMRKWKLKNL